MAYALQGSTGSWEVVVGLEVHAQVVSNSKLFSGAATAFGAEPNTQVSFVDAAFPGMLPVINRVCVEQAVKTGLGLNAAINKVSRFDRKNYFYADLPAGYQISQYEHPIVGKGEIEIECADGSTKLVGITRLHLEQDAGKSLHDQHSTKSFIDLNRAGVALMEIVSEPDIRSPDEAGAYLRKLRSILRYLGTCDGNMEEGSMRADVNVSVRKPGETGYRTRCEVKNVNSIRFAMQAVEAEALRQIEVWESGAQVQQETRLFDSNRGVTRAMRSKEDAHDYRYFPDPDLLPLVLDQAWIDDLRAHLPELPDAKKARFMGDYGLTEYDARQLTESRDTAEYFEALARDFPPKMTANFMLNDLAARIKQLSSGTTFGTTSAFSLPVSSAILGMIHDGTINKGNAQVVMDDIVLKAAARVRVDADIVRAIVDEKGLSQVSDTAAIDAAVDKIIAANQDKVTEFRSGKDKLFGFFVGQVMKAMQGKANPALVNQTLKRRLS